MSELNSPTSSIPYYKQIDNTKYDRGLLSRALTMMATDRNLQITEENMRYLCNSTRDGGKVTECEIKTLEYIIVNYDVSSSAKLICTQFIRKQN